MDIAGYILGGLVIAFFVALVLQLVVKPLLQTQFGTDWPWFAVAVNILALVLALPFAFAVEYNSGVAFDAPRAIVNTILLAVVAAGLATLGYEGVTNIQKLISGSKDGEP